MKNNIKRGKHKNIVSKHLLVAIQGNCKVKCIDNVTESIFYLDSPEKGLYINCGVYKEMFDFSEDAILLCLADTKYDPDEYVE